MQELRNKAVESNSTSALRTLLGTLQDPKAGNKGISGLDLEVKSTPLVCLENSGLNARAIEKKKHLQRE